MELKKLRKSVDSLDTRILELLNKRANVIINIGHAKTRGNHAIFMPDREKAVYDQLSAKNSGPLSNDAVKAIYREIMSSSLQLEKALTIAYLGPECTFTHLAGIKKFGSMVDYSPCETITDVFMDVEKGRSNYGVVPIENSIEGAVNHSLDMFIDADLKICSEVFLEIRHNLLSKETDKRRIKKVYSKDQVFGQCRSWIEANLPGVTLIEVPSTAKAAEIAAAEKGAGCIAGEFAARKYKLNILFKSIEDSMHNVTRFLVIGKTDALPSGKDKTSLMFSVKDSAGALHDMLLPFKKYGINMTKIESRPSKVRPWEYYFFVDIEGHCQNLKVQKALTELKKVCSFVKVLGSYPFGEKV